MIPKFNVGDTVYISNRNLKGIIYKLKRDGKIYSKSYYTYSLTSGIHFKLLKIGHNHPIAIPLIEDDLVTARIVLTEKFLKIFKE